MTEDGVTGEIVNEKIKKFIFETYKFRDQYFPKL